MNAISDYTLNTWGIIKEEQYMRQLQACMSQLGTNSMLGTPRDDVRPGLRSFPCGRHKIYFRQAPHGVNISGVLHQSQDPKKYL
ncbi:type II toxin-antitoxin system RelE/ParE family toxin [Pantoea sp. CCBC3-3-1]|nr:type II toxin-antitoxin system RelE/ParE family toxin [Pantoea sp. CCBC3-3-1]